MLCGSLIKIWNLATTWKNKTNQNTISISEKLKTKALRFFVSIFFHVNCKISNSNMRTEKHLAQASCTELTLTVESPHLSLNILRRLQKSEKIFQLILKWFQNRSVRFFSNCVSFLEKVSLILHTVLPHIVSAETILFWLLPLMYCDLWLQYINVRKLFKGGNYSRAETIWGNTVLGIIRSSIDRWSDCI